MIWADASFAVEWLAGTKRALEVGLSPRARTRILPMQYAEVCTFFLRRDPQFARDALDSFDLVHADAEELLNAAILYIHARTGGSKASLADAVLAATVLNRGGLLYAFDEDFRHLGLHREAHGRWMR